MFAINTIFQSAPDVVTIITGFTRLLGIDEQKLAYMIQLDINPLQAPFSVPLRELISEIDEGRILTDQVYDCKLAATIDQLSIAARNKQKEAISHISTILNDGGAGLLFNSQYRVVVFAKYAKEQKLNIRTLRRLYYRYLWGGQTEQALSPSFKDRGSLGMSQKKGSLRRGRKPKDSVHLTSIVTLPMVREKLIKGAKFFYLPGNRTFKKALVKTLKVYFSKSKILSQKSGLNSQSLEEILLSPEQLPTERQFRYVCNLLELETGKRSKLPGRIRPRKKERLLIGRARDGVCGPGHRFEIDATKLQIKLVSRYGREQIVGNPTLYIIIDCWSGAYVGYALSLHNASWALAASALLNCFTSKEEVFKKLGLDYKGSDWFCHHLPSNLSGDRAELISDKAGNVPHIGITVEVMSPMRPDRKGKVEAAIKDLKHRRSLALPGSYTKYQQRRETNGDDTAALTINELEVIIVDSIMRLNNDPVPLEHIPPEMLEDETNDVTHIEMYKWGLKHLTGLTRTMEPKLVYSNLLTTASASLTTHGIYYKKQTYKSPHLANASFSTNKGRDSIEIRYDEHHAEQVWFFDKINDEWASALNVNENVRRLEAAFYELESFRDDAEKRREKAKMENLHQEDEQDKKHALTIKNAKEETKTAKRGRSRSRNNDNVRRNKAVEALSADILSSGRAVISNVTAMISLQDTKLPLIQHNKTIENEEGNVTAQSITQRSKDLWRSNDDVD